MKSKHEAGRSAAKPKINPVAEGSLKGRTGGSVPADLDRGNQQLVREAMPGTDGAGTRGGAGTQQTGWGARQHGERLDKRAEESRQGVSQQSGYGGTEQKQHAGSQESATGPAGKRQTDESRPKRR